MNGNKLLLLLALFSFASCDLFKKAEVDKPRPDKEELDPIQGRRIYDPETGTYILVEEMPTEKMDTIRWKEVPESSVPVITSESAFVVDEGEKVEVIGTGDNESRLLSRYNVAVLLPFLSDRFSPGTDQIEIGLSEWTLNFYGGMRMALDDLDAEGIQLSVNVVDTEASEPRLTRELRTNQDLINAHLIIGPYRRDNVRVAAEFVKPDRVVSSSRSWRDNRTTGSRQPEENPVLISPYSASSGLTSGNPNFVQVSPTLQTHCEAITRHARARYRPEQIVLVCRDQEAEIQRLDYFQQENYRLAGTRSVDKFRELIISAEAEDFAEMDLLPLIELSDTTVFIIPSWSSESFVYSFLRKLDLTRDEFQTIIVYGMPQWMDYEIIDYEYYEKLNVHVSSSVYLDPLSTDVKFFKRRFYERFGAAPTEEAFVGYDVMYYFGRMLDKYGTRFQYQLERNPEEVLHTIFNFQKVIAPDDMGRENPTIDHFGNNFVNILRFQDYQFRPATD